MNEKKKRMINSKSPLELFLSFGMIFNLFFTAITAVIAGNMELTDNMQDLAAFIIFARLVTTHFVFIWLFQFDYEAVKPRKLTTLEKAQRVINKGEYKKQLKKDKEELKRRKEISKTLKYIEQAIIAEAKHGNREFTFDLPIDYCVKDVELYLQNHGFKAKIDNSEKTLDGMLNFCHPLYIKW